MAEPIDQRVMVDHQAEFEVIATLLQAPHAIDKIRLEPVDFFNGACREAFLTIRQMVDAGEVVDAVTVAEKLPSNGAVNQAGGLAWLGDVCTNSLGNALRIEAYAGIVRKHSANRKMSGISGEIADLAANTHLPFSDKIAKADSMIAAIAAQSDKNTLTVHIDSAIQSYITELQAREGENVAGIPTGLSDLDELINGLQLTNLYIIGGRPSMGKTSLAMGIALSAAACKKSVFGEGDHGVFVFSQEMSTSSLIDRAMAATGSIDPARLRRGALTDDDYDRLSAAIGRLHKLPVWINDKAAITLGDIRRELREHRGDNIRVIVVDYLQLMTGPGATRNLAVEEISRGLKQIAKDFNVAVIVLSQLSRKVDERADRRPILSDLRDSGAIEQDGDVIMFVYRDEVYKPDTQDKGIAEIIVAKQRNGPLGVVRTFFRGEYTRFDSCQNG